jgi:apolipoprotein N-acyltransferase
MNGTSRRGGPFEAAAFVLGVLLGCVSYAHRDLREVVAEYALVSVGVLIALALCAALAQRLARSSATSGPSVWTAADALRLLQGSKGFLGKVLGAADLLCTMALILVAGFWAAFMSIHLLFGR